MILVKTHNSENSNILTLCDHDLIGKQIGHIVIDEKFYKGEKMESEKIIKLIKISGSINAFGIETIKFLLDNKIINKETIKYFDKVPHAQIFTI